MSTFLSGFEGRWRRPAVDYKAAVRSHMITLDTNVLLELYRFTPAARDELLNVIEQLRERIWIPNQVASEFYARRMDAVKERLKLHEAIPKSLEDLKRKAIQELQVFARRCSLTDEDKEKLLSPIEASFASAIGEVQRQSKAFDLTLESVVSDDPILSSLARILDERVGQPFNPEETEDLIKEADRRYAAQIPPGYKDAGKEENSHGDFFIWEQMLREALKREASLLFVTNDTKEDWVAKESGLVIGARPELIAEFKDRRNGGDFLVVQLSSFLRFAKEELGAAISPSTLEQAKNLQDNQKLNDAVEVAFEQEMMRIIPDALRAEVRRLESLTGDTKRSFRARREAGRSAARVADLIERLAIFPKTLLPGGEVRLALTAEDYQILSDVIQRQSLYREARSTESPAVKTSLPYRDLVQVLEGQERMRMVLATEYEDVRRHVHVIRAEVDSLRMAEEGGMRLAEAEHALRSAEQTQHELLVRIADVDAVTSQTRRLIEERINSESNAIQMRISDID